ncbi:ribosome small subunit-dependent GTPase A [Mycoplasma phocoenae]|uniref:Small ribosomal subunit biogenesis GTPase RsgA n=1 Tax=Mycoplasma phocoenae TaxID=754517 RepID=A0A858U6M9_9MOLU|nr:ribosome small subunit-dependent GTPase A [Mycoplasma phocoenae]QJG66883.1 ribosome small subunit-dependent GTPase A [Mycoplasma phocoenae]
MLRGKIIKSLAGFYYIKTTDGKIHTTRGGGKLRLLDITPTVGDYVHFESDGLIHKIDPRRNSFIRPKIVNVDQAIVVSSLVEPNFSSSLVDKFLLIIESKEVEPIIVLTKKDLTTKTYKDYYSQQGYKVFEIDYSDHTSYAELENIFKNKTSFLVGQTGVGKTTLINHLAKTNFETQQISKALNRGKHTTREVSLIDFNEGEIIDTPGFSSFDFDIDIDNISIAYKTFRENAVDCKFRNCKHFQEKEENCKIKQLVTQNKIPKERYDNYLMFLNQLMNK